MRAGDGCRRAPGAGRGAAKAGCRPGRGQGQGRGGAGRDGAEPEPELGVGRGEAGDQAIDPEGRDVVLGQVRAKTPKRKRRLGPGAVRGLCDLLKVQEEALLPESRLGGASGLEAWATVLAGVYLPRGRCEGSWTVREGVLEMWEPPE